MLLTFLALMPVLICNFREAKQKKLYIFHLSLLTSLTLAEYFSFREPCLVEHVIFKPSCKF